MARVQELLRREVINLSTGEKMGYACDVDINPETGRLAALIVPERVKGMNLFGKTSETVILWEDVRRISDDLIMVETGLSVKRD